MKLVIIESPYAGETKEIVDANLLYTRTCMADCLSRGEAPYASQILYAHEHVLDDNDPEERKLGIEAGLAWGMKADASVVYTDRGVSAGMALGIEAAHKAGRPVIYRSIYDTQMTRRAA